MKRTRALKGDNLKPSRVHRPLTADQLRWQCEPAALRVASTNDVEPRREIIGQERALRALRVGLEMYHSGYNIFVTGFSGTGRTTTIKRMLREFENKHATLRDHCYVYNFRNPDMPIALSLPAGQGRGLKQDMENLLNELMRDVPAVYESQRYQRQRRLMAQHFQDRQKIILQDFERRVKEQGFDLVQVQVGTMMRPDVVPVVNGAAASLEQVEELVRKGEVTKADFEKMRETLAELEKQMAVVFRELRNIEKRVQESLGQLEDQIIMPVVNAAVDAVKTAYDDAKVHAYLEDVRAHLRENLDRFRQQQVTLAAASDKKDDDEPVEEENFHEFLVNVLVDNSDSKHVPIVIETNPKYKNIFGTVERDFERGGVWRTDFTKIKAGSLLRADGGYLVLNALDALIEPGVWQDLKRTLRTLKLDIQTSEPAYGIAVSGMKPEPFDINVKVIIIGETELYYFLWHRDEDFKKIFKVRADFDFEMVRTPETMGKYISFLRMVCEDEHLLPFDATALAQIIEFGVRLAGSKKKISTRFNVIADVAREANYWAKKAKAKAVNGHHVEKAIEERVYRVKLVEAKIQDLIDKRIILIDTSGKKVGQVNGLSIYDTGEHMFGKPSRITAKTSLGRSGVINIEREAEMSGPTHTKGVAILSGYFRDRFAQNKPLIMDASITFEQSYGGVDGDSASSTEIYAILSSLSDLPLRQDIAVTGSVNQNGEIQPIGGVNEKIEGFFDTCKVRGLTGTQGVMIPVQNVDELMLREEVYEAVKKKRFHIYAVTTIDEGIEILTGVRSGQRIPNGGFETGTVHGKADAQLMKYAEAWRIFEGGKS
ncbi:MAG: ATP-dependent protease [Ignavibacteria bacterium RIFCSPLOWO2_02_FULL_55_14]|nr:MAG: ATP-dependent protease [Ignavibacteria bacterium RIFCSPLOWO2_02_FULL_55_14]